MAQTRIKERIDALYQRVQAEGSDLSADYGDPRLRQAEFNVMIDEMLGADYDPQKRSRLLEIQASLVRGRAIWTPLSTTALSLAMHIWLACGRRWTIRPKPMQRCWDTRTT